MLSVDELRDIASARLKDAKVLFQQRRWDGAKYVLGFAVEIALKVRICSTLRWDEFPETGREFDNRKFLRTHDLDLLLQLSGVENKVKPKYLSEWSAVREWSPDLRYHRVVTASEEERLSAEVRDMIEAATKLVRYLRR